MAKLNEEQKNEILSEYGGDLELIERIEKILSVCDLYEDDYLEIVIDIVSEYESNQTKLLFDDRTAFHSIDDIIKHILLFKLKENQEKYYNLRSTKILRY